MDANSFTFADLSRFLKRAPRVRTYAIPVALFLVADFILVRDLLFTVFAFIVPIVAVILIDMAFVSAAKFNFPRRRIYYLDFISFFLAEVYFLILRLAFPGFLSLEYQVMLAFATAGLLRSMVLYTYYTDRYRNIFLPSLGFTAAVMIGLAFIDFNHLTYLYFFGISIIFSVGGYAFANISVRDFKDEFGQSPIKILNFFLNSRVPGINEDEARKFFSKIYNRKSDVPVQVVDIVRKSGSRKVVLVFPYIHPGPFGNIGTSNIPYKLQTRMKQAGTDLMVFHTTTTNSNNSAREEDIDALAEAADRALEKVQYCDTISRFSRIEVGGHVLGLLRFGNYGIGAMIPGKDKFDDVSLSEGLKMIETMKKAGAEDFIALDAQTHFLQGAPSLDDLKDITSVAKSEFGKLAAEHSPRIGYAKVAVKAEAMGPVGVQCIVLETDAGLQALVLTDSNNITEELISKSKAKASGYVDDIEFFTTDNHYINAGTLDMNPLGQRDDPEMLSEHIAECIRKASEDVEECRIGMATEHVSVSMGEESTFKRLLDSVFVALRKARLTISVLITACIASSVLISYFLFYVLHFI